MRKLAVEVVTVEGMELMANIRGRAGLDKDKVFVEQDSMLGWEVEVVAMDMPDIQAAGQDMDMEVLAAYNTAMGRFSYSGEYIVVDMVQVVQAIQDNLVHQADPCNREPQVGQLTPCSQVHRDIQEDQANQVGLHSNWECTLVHRPVDKDQDT